MRWVYFIPTILFFALVGLLGWNLIQSRDVPQDQQPSALLDKPAPRLALPPLDAKTDAFGARDLASGHVTVLNVWASWCVPCRAEAPALAQLAGVKGIALYGLVYKDTPAKARAYLDETGNPYARIDLDGDGEAGIDWGVTGVPETFVIDGKGIVRLRYAGPLVGSALSEIVLPAIARAQKDS
jgi:cytochrome c biogenesis protein CcmG, thiol:disulfide interchange protein DsbE